MDAAEGIEGSFSGLTTYVRVRTLLLRHTTSSHAHVTCDGRRHRAAWP